MAKTMDERSGAVEDFISLTGKKTELFLSPIVPSNPQFPVFSDRDARFGDRDNLTQPEQTNI
jgi:hypothetical protein